MIRFVAPLLFLAVLAGSFGCRSLQYQTPLQPPRGWALTSLRAPLTLNFDKTPVCEKRGMASTYYVWVPVFGILELAWDSAGIQDAAYDGNLKTIEYADYEVLSVLGVFGRFTVIAYGN